MEIYFPQHIDSTMLSTYRSCENKFLEEFIYGVTPSGISPDLHAGGAVAAALETTRRALWDLKLPFEEALSLGYQEFIRFWGEFEAPEGHVKQFDRVATAFICIWDWFGVETDPIKPFFLENGKAAVEMRFSIPIPVNHPVSGDPLFYSGRYDLLGLFQDQVYIVDDKTTKSLGQAWLKRWDLRSQFMGYCWSAKQQGLPVVGAIARGIGILKTDINFAESMNTYSEELLDRWYDQMVRDVRRMVQCWEEKVWGYDFDEACNMYGGCPYKVLCRSNPANRDSWLESFDHRIWDPLAKDPSHTLETYRKRKEAQQDITYAISF